MENQLRLLCCFQLICFTTTETSSTLQWSLLVSSAGLRNKNLISLNTEFPPTEYTKLTSSNVVKTPTEASTPLSGSRIDVNDCSIVHVRDVIGDNCYSLSLS